MGALAFGHRRSARRRYPGGRYPAACSAEDGLCASAGALPAANPPPRRARARLWGGLAWCGRAEGSHPSAAEPVSAATVARRGGGTLAAGIPRRARPKTACARPREPSPPPIHGRAEREPGCGAVSLGAEEPSGATHPQPSQSLRLPSLGPSAVPWRQVSRGVLGRRRPARVRGSPTPPPIHRRAEREPGCGAGAVWQRRPAPGGNRTVEILRYSSARVETSRRSVPTGGGRRGAWTAAGRAPAGAPAGGIPPEPGSAPRAGGASGTPLHPKQRPRSPPARSCRFACHPWTDGRQWLP